MVRFLGSSRIHFHLPLVYRLICQASTSRSTQNVRVRYRVGPSIGFGSNRNQVLLGRIEYYSAIGFVNNFQRDVDIVMAIITEERSCRDFRLDRFRRVFYSNPSRPTLRLKSHFDRLFEETTLECRI